MVSERPKKEVILSFSIGHDANACLASSEGEWGYENSERVDCIKQSSDYLVAADRLLMRLGVQRKDVSLITLTTTQGALMPIINEKKFDVLGWKQHKYITPIFNGSRGKIEGKESKWIAYSSTTKNAKAPCMRYESLSDFRRLASGEIMLKAKDFIIEGTANFYGKSVRCLHIEHHLAHIFSAFMRQKNANICISMDGASHSPSSLRFFPFWGGLSAAKVGQDLILSPPSLFTGGILYSKAASFLGLTEGKLMGLAGYFRVNENADSQVIEEWNDLTIKVERLCDIKSSLADRKITEIASDDQTFENNLYSLLEDIGKLHKELQSPSACLEGIPEASHILIAASVQKIFERMRLKAVENELKFFQKKRVKTEGIVFTGGCTLNCPSNKIISERYQDMRLIFDNACNDEGLSLGAFYAINYLDHGFQFDAWDSISSPFIGSHVEFLDEAKELALNLGFRVMDLRNHADAANKIARALTDMRIIILCHGRYESGPRALGNRSFIGNASDRSTHDILNYIKQRENWRPIAPMVREVDFARYFSGPMDPHMLMNDVVIDKSSIPAVTHFDNSARVQVVRDSNSIAYKVMSSLSKEGQCSVLANTSLNQKNEPLINSAVRAIRLMSEFEAISGAFFGDFYVEKLPH